MRKEDELEKEVLKKLTDPLQVQFLPFLLITDRRLRNWFDIIQVYKDANWFCLPHMSSKVGMERHEPDDYEIKWYDYTEAWPPFVETD